MQNRVNSISPISLVVSLGNDINSYPPKSNTFGDYTSFYNFSNQRNKNFYWSAGPKKWHVFSVDFKFALFRFLRLKEWVQNFNDDK